MRKIKVQIGWLAHNPHGDTFLVGQETLPCTQPTGKYEKRWISHSCRAGFFLAGLSLVAFCPSSRSIDPCSRILFNWYVACSCLSNCYPESVLLPSPNSHYLPSDPIALLARLRESKQINPLPWTSTLDRLPVRRFHTGLVTWTVW